MTEQFSISSPASRSWYYRMINEKCFAVSTYRNGGVCLCLIYSLEQVMQELAAELDEYAAEVFLVNGSTILGREELQKRFQPSSSFNDIEEGGYYFCRERIVGTPLIMCAAVPLRIWSYMTLQQLILLLVMVLIICFFVFSYFRIRKELFVPLERLTKDMQRIGGGDWSHGILSESRFLEIGQVIYTTDRMIEEIEKQKMEVYERTIQEQKARLQYLSLQLNPHFYLNGLKTMNVLAINGDNRKIKDMSIRLSGHLRYLLEMEKDMVCLREEKTFVENYVDLYKEMTDRRISLEWNISKDVLDCLVPRLCIQTFVENSFKYAKLGDTAGELSISVSANKLEMDEIDLLEITVHDNGKGYDREILAILNDVSDESTKSVGISNLKRRCDIMFQGKAEYAFYNDHGAVSDIFYPYQKEV